MMADKSRMSFGEFRCIGFQMFNVQCSILNVQCSMLNAQW